MMKSVLITGANSGLGKECARQLALQDETEKIKKYGKFFTIKKMKKLNFIIFIFQ